MPKKKNKNRGGNPARQPAPRPAPPDGAPAPRLPEDRKPPAGARVARLDGRDWPLRPGIDDDWELADMLAELEDNPLSSPKVVKYVLGDDPDAYAAMKREATVDGRVSAKRMGELLRGVLKGSAPNS